MHHDQEQQRQAPTLATTPFETLVRTDPDLAELRAASARDPNARRRSAAEWVYYRGAADDLLGPLLGGGRADPTRTALESLAIDPEYAPARMTVAVLTYDYGREDEAMEALLALTALPEETEDLVEIIDRAGDALIDRGDLENAERLYAAAARVHPSVSRYPAGRGYCAGKAGRLEESVQHHRRAAALDPEKPVVLSDLGYALIEAGQYEEAELVLRRAVALDPAEASLARANLDWLRTLRAAP